MKIVAPETLDKVYNIRTTTKTANKINKIARREKIKPSVLIRLVLNNWAENYDDQQ